MQLIYVITFFAKKTLRAQNFVFIELVYFENMMLFDYNKDERCKM